MVASLYNIHLFYLYTKRRSGIEIELMAREKEGKDIDARSNPAVVSILRVTSVHHFVELTHRGEVVFVT